MMIRNPQKVQEYYAALVNRDASYVGLFFAGVKTTSIFCIATCRARKPKPENVDFFTSFKEALDNGFRPCKICQPTKNANEAPAFVEKALQLLKDQPKEKIKDQQLREVGIQPESLRRWFQKHYNMTFHAYQRMYRINTAYQELQQGKQTTSTAFDVGYESLSGFGYTYKKLMGEAPQYTSEPPILMSRLTTPIGPMFVCATEQGICLLEFVDRRMLETEFRDLQKRLKRPILAGENPHIQQVKAELIEYFAGTRKIFSVPLHAPGSEFQQKVWQVLSDIPYGETVSYQEQAIKLGNSRVVRAVARANGANRMAILIPCHRVIGKDGKLVGYGGGLERKRWLLELEQQFGTKAK